MPGLIAIRKTASKSLTSILDAVLQRPTLLDRNAPLRLGEYPDYENFADERPTPYRVVVAHREIPTIVLIVLAVVETEAPRLGLLDATSGCCMVIAREVLIEGIFREGRSPEYLMEASATLMFAASTTVGST